MRQRWFSIAAPISLRGRKFKGLRGWAGKPFHPPLTDIPVAGYVLAAVFDVISWVAADSIARDAYVAGTWVLASGFVVSLAAALTGFWDWWQSTPKHSQAWRTVNWHMTVMGTTTLVVIADLVLRIENYDAGSAPVAVGILSVAAGTLVAYGALYGGALVYEYGFNVENAVSTPEWKPSDRDRYPGESHVGEGDDAQPPPVGFESQPPP